MPNSCGDVTATAMVLRGDGAFKRQLGPGAPLLEWINVFLTDGFTLSGLNWFSWHGLFS
jgi:hypothetical protein